MRWARNSTSGLVSISRSSFYRAPKGERPREGATNPSTALIKEPEKDSIHFYRRAPYFRIQTFKWALMM